MIDIENLLTQVPIASRIAIAKTLATLLAVCAYFCNSGIAFYATISSTIGICYYILLATHPQAMVIVHMILHYRYTRVKNCVTQNIFNYRSKLETLLRGAPKASKALLGGNGAARRAESTVLEYDDGYSSIEYIDDFSTPQSKKFVYLFHDKHRSNDLIVFKDESGKDVTNNIEKYLGPLQNFHGSPLTPKDLGHEKMSVFREGQINMFRTFEKNEPITFA